MRFRLTDGETSGAVEFDANVALELQQHIRSAWDAFVTAGIDAESAVLRLEVQSEVESWLWLKGSGPFAPRVARLISANHAERLLAESRRMIEYDRSMWESVDSPTAT